MTDPTVDAHQGENAGCSSSVVSLALVELGAGPQLREGLDPERLAALEGHVERFAPVLVRAATYEVLDGAHRVEVLRQAGHTHIAVQLVDGDEVEALRQAIAANAGGCLTTSERRRAVWLLLTADPTQSDRQIARAIPGLSATTVGGVRAKAVAAGDIPEVTVRQGADGKQYAAPASTSEEAVRPRRRRLRAWLDRLARVARALLRAASRRS